ncbi:AzlC family ABC transporter permease [Amphibiibacter pelophylacis]|uniref:AzlC family ABC transporter permease n=1 Tax=Amphibiibacter pelophylacis TaxID=1799477 RepID=A0ACC6P493_9BURK
MKPLPYWQHPDFRRGVRDMLATAPGQAAWGLVTGVAMVDSGLPVPLALLMSLTVYAGSAQLAVLPLLVSGAAPWVIWLTALCVNLRFVVFSASWRPFFRHYPLGQRALAGYMAGDIGFVLFMRHFASGQPAAADAPRDSLPYFWGSSWTGYLAWHIPSLIGIALAGSVPTTWNLGFAGTLALVALACSLVGSPATWLAAAAAGTVSVLAVSLPYKLNIVLAIAAAVAVGVTMEKRRGE